MLDCFLSKLVPGIHSVRSFEYNLINCKGSFLNDFLRETRHMPLNNRYLPG